MTKEARRSSLTTMALAGSGLVGATIGCDEVAKQCGIECDDQAYLNGQASISGVPEGAVLRVATTFTTRC